MRGRGRARKGEGESEGKGACEGEGEGACEGEGEGACDATCEGEGEGACEGEGARRMVMAMAMARAHARTRARAGAHASMRGRERMRGRGHRRGCIIYTWRGARARWRGRRRGPVHGRGALQARDELRASTQRNCMQARSARERRGGGMPSAREGNGRKQADANDRRASGSSIETRKPATQRTFLKRGSVAIASTPCWFSYFQGGYIRIVKVPPQIADLRREVLAATTVVSFPVFAPVIKLFRRTESLGTTSSTDCTVERRASNGSEPPRATEHIQLHSR